MSGAIFPALAPSTDARTGRPPVAAILLDRLRRHARPSLLVAGLLLGCLAVAAASLALPSTLDYDPWNWVIWGRQVSMGHLDTGGGTAWKPLPVLFTTVFAAAGSAAPDLWLVVARAGALLALVLAYRVGRRLGGRWAGVLAAGGLLLLRQVLHDFYLGESEGLLVALVLAAIDRHLAGRRTAALLLGAMAGLLRPEGWPLLIVYGAWLWRREPDRRPLVAGVAVALPALWFVPDWLASGAPLAGVHRARDSIGAQRIDAFARPWYVVLIRTKAMLPFPVELAAASGVLLALWRRDRTLLALGGGGLIWIATVAVMAQLGYPGLQRFLVPVAAVMCLLAAVTFTRAVGALGRRRTALVTATAALAVLVGTAHVAMGQLSREATREVSQVRLADQLTAAVRHTGGPRQVLACGQPQTTALAVPTLQWALGSQAEVGHRPSRPPFILFALQASPEALPNPPLPQLAPRVRRVANRGQWHIVASCRHPSWRPMHADTRWSVADTGRLALLRSRRSWRSAPTGARARRARHAALTATADAAQVRGRSLLRLAARGLRSSTGALVFVGCEARSARVARSGTARPRACW